MGSKKKERVLILGAAGRDFHNFNLFFRDNDRYEVVGFTATQIPRIAGRVYPPELSGGLYPEGIPIYEERNFEDLIRDYSVDQVILAYSDLKHMTVMHLASRAMASGADFRLLGSKSTMIEADVPVIAVCAVRTGCGKSQTSRYVSRVLKEMGKRVVAIRHPMPYGDLNDQRVERFATHEDLDNSHCTIEEREEYEAHLDQGIVVYAGVDYQDILAHAQDEADVIIWDGGNNDLPFIRPDLWITLVDPLRPGHEMHYHPGEVNFRRADVILINKANTAAPEVVAEQRETVRLENPGARVVVAASEVVVDDPGKVAGRKVLLVEDGPTLTHGEMPFGAGKVAAERYGAAEIVDPRPYAVGSIHECFETYGNLVDLIPAVGYYPEQIRDLEETINATECDLVLISTPIDLGKIIKINKPSVRVRYMLDDMGDPTLQGIVREFVEGLDRKQGE